MRIRVSGVFGILGVTVGVAGILVPILWDRYKAKASLELELLARSVLVSVDAGLEGLRISYQSRQISELTRLDFRLTNAGRVPIREADLIIPPRINFVDSVIPVEATTGELIPAEMQVTTTLDTTARQIELGFPLMNPGDAVRFSILVTGPGPEFTATARIVGLPSLVFVDRTTDPERPRSWTVLAVAGVTVLLLVIIVIGSWQMAAEFRIRDLVVANAIPWPKAATPGLYEAFFRVWLREKTKDDRKSLDLLLTQLSPEDHPTEEQERMLRVEFFRVASDVTNTTFGFWIVLILIVVGAVYSIPRLL